MSGRALKLSDEDEARVRQDVVSSAHRAFDARGFGARTFPGFLVECIRKRVWEHERRLEGGGSQGPVSFAEFITKPYPVGIGAELETVDAIVAEDIDMATEWERLTGRVVGPRRIALSRIRRDGETQVREEISQSVVADYAKSLDALPPVEVFDDGSDLWLGDGFHRCAAFEAQGVTEVPCIVRKGTRRDALLFAVGANAKHGLRRTNADKHRAVELLLRDEEWVEKSDHWISEKCGVSQPFVGKIRSELITVIGSSGSGKRTGRDGKKRKSPDPKPTEPKLPEEPKPRPEAWWTCPIDGCGKQFSQHSAAVRGWIQRGFCDDCDAEPNEPDPELPPAPTRPIAWISPLVTEAFRLVERMTPAERLDFDRQIRPLIAAAETTS